MNYRFARIFGFKAKMVLRVQTGSWSIAGQGILKYRAFLRMCATLPGQQFGLVEMVFDGYVATIFLLDNGNWLKGK
jgi:hypothetical protein